MFDKNRIAAAAVGLLALGAAVAFPATAAADDGPPDPPAAPGDPGPPPPPPPSVPGLGQLSPSGLDVLAQRGEDPAGAPGTLGMPPMAGMDRDTVLAQNAVPTAPGGGFGTPPNLNVFNNAYGAGAINLKPAAPGKGQQFGVAPGDENADVSKRQWLGRYIDLYRAGDLKGGLLGQLPQEQLGQPLPGTAPPPGTVIPAGPVQFLPDPADGPTPPPGLVLPPPPPDPSPPAG